MIKGVHRPHALGHLIHSKHSNPLFIANVHALIVSVNPTEEYDNPPNLINVRLALIGAISMLLFGIAVVALTDWAPELKLWYMMVVSIGAALLLALIWMREYYRRPDLVEVNPEGVYLFFQQHEPRFVPWNEIEVIQAEPGDPDTLRGRWQRSGMLKMNGLGHYYTLDYDIAMALEEEHLRKMRDAPSRP